MRDEKIKEVIIRLAAEFLKRHPQDSSLVTVTDIELTRKGRGANVFVTVLPDERTGEALKFLRRIRSDFRKYVMEHSRLARIPRFEFEIDAGEKNRQKIDELSSSV